jgi:rod shape-determining protein MreD
MVQDNFKTLFGFIFLVLLQNLIFDNVNLFGYSCPAVYLFFVIGYRFDKSQFTLIILGFLLGLTVDLFQNSSGANTISTLFISFIRPFIIKFSFGVNPDNISILSMKTRLDKQLVYIVLLTLIHQFVLQSVAYFDLDHFVLILRNTVMNSTLTFILLFAALNLFKKKA